MFSVGNKVRLTEDCLLEEKYHGITGVISQIPYEGGDTVGAYRFTPDVPVEDEPAHWIIWGDEMERV